MQMQSEAYRSTCLEKDATKCYSLDVVAYRACIFFLCNLLFCSECLSYWVTDGCYLLGSWLVLWDTQLGLYWAWVAVEKMSFVKLNTTQVEQVWFRNVVWCYIIWIGWRGC